MMGITRKIWALESGFATDNAERDAWFAQNPTFLVTQNKKSGHLLFAPLAYEYARIHKRDNLMRKMSLWETTSATKVEESEDGEYKCFETESGTRYHIYHAGDMSL